MKYIETLHEGERLSGIYLCKYRQSAMTKNGKSYENVILQDKTGVIDAKIWDPNSQGIEDFDMLDMSQVFREHYKFPSKEYEKQEKANISKKIICRSASETLMRCTKSCSRMCIKSRIRI